MCVSAETFAHPTDRVMRLEIGAGDYLTKPLDPRELLARAKAVLRRTVEKAAAPTRSETRPLLCFVGWRLDVARRELRSTDNVLVLHIPRSIAASTFRSAGFATNSSVIRRPRS